MSQVALFIILLAVVLISTATGAIFGWVGGGDYRPSKMDDAFTFGAAGFIVGLFLVIIGLGLWWLAGLIT